MRETKSFPIVGRFGRVSAALAAETKPPVNVCLETDMKTKRSAIGAKHAECALF